MRSLGFYLYLPKLSSIKVTVAFKMEKEPDLFIFLSGEMNHVSTKWLFIFF